jgi:hypothetical protein
MAGIPEKPTPTPEQMFERLQVWFGMSDQLAQLKTAEVLARKDLAAYYFPEPSEGTNRLDIGLGYDLKLDHKINRDVDEAALMGLDAKALKLIEKLQIPMGELFVQKWELKTGAYRTLNDAQRQFVDGLLTIKEGTPAMAIVPKADAAGHAAHKAAAEQAAAADAPQYKYDVHLGDEADTQEGQYFRDAEGVWWLLDGEEWQEITTMQTLEELEVQHTAMTTKPKKARKPRAKAGAK